MVATLVVYAMAFGLVVWRLVDVQVIRADEYANRGVQQRARDVVLPASRGRLYDRDGNVLATSVDTATIYADPSKYRSSTTPTGLLLPPAAEADRVAAGLAEVLGLDATELTEVLRRDTHFTWVARQVDWELGQQVLALGMPGIGVLTEPARVYPAGSLAAQVIGFTGIDGAGLQGLELAHQDILAGRAGQLVLERAPGGLSIASATREVVAPVPGTDLVLTLDRDIQHVAEQAAQQAVDDTGAVGASVVVIEVGSGDILAMASAPGFDANDLQAGGAEQWRNRAVTDVFEPGSVQKAVTAAAALEAGIVGAGTVFEVADNIRVGNKTFTDSHRHATQELTFRQIIERSSNVGTIQVAQLLGDRRLAAAIDRFGFGQRTGAGLPGEVTGIVLPVDQWWTTSLPTIAIGHGIAMTLLQAANFYATIANDGIRVTPRVVRGQVGADGRLVPAAAGAQDRLLTSTTATTLLDVLTGVVEGDGGTGALAGVAGYEMAGKTGTARKPRADGAGYSDQYIASFVGIAPATNPRVVVAVMVDEPYPIWGGVVAAPVFSEVAGFALRHLGVAPTIPNPPLGQALDQAVAAAEAAARLEGPATSADANTSPVAGAGAPGDR